MSLSYYSLKIQLTTESYYKRSMISDMVRQQFKPLNNSVGTVH